MEAVGQDSTQIACKFITKLPEQYIIPNTEIAIPASLTRYGLSQVVNHLLELEEARPFDFLINGVLIRATIGKFLLEHGISAESILEVEYIFATTPPEPRHQIPHDDWIGAIEGSNENWLATGGYDGLLRFWNGSGEPIGQNSGHRGPISSLAKVPDPKQTLLLSAGKIDCLLHLVEVARSKGGKIKTGTKAVYKGHRKSVLDISVSPSGQNCVSASHDHSLRLWPTGSDAIELASQSPEAGETISKKKLRAENGASQNVQVPTIESLQEFDGHKDGVTCVSWPSENHIFSGSMDFSVRMWNVESGINTDTYNGHRALSCLSTSPSGIFVAFGGSSKAWNLWDTRSRPEADSGLKTFLSHTSHLHKIAWHPTSENYLVTASLDRTAKLWDVRSSVPLHTLESHNEQVLCCCWWKDSRIATGSADKTVRIFDVKFGEFQT